MDPTQLLEDERRWQAVQSKDSGQDGQFWYGVLTTGVYCRPSCPGRTPLRGNVRFFETVEAAERAGLRACLRCHPRQAGHPDPNATRIARLCRYIQTHAENELPLADLAGRAGLSVFHFQRSFKAVTGLTPREYLKAVRLRNLKANLRRGESVTEAIYETGYGSSSRVYERLDTSLGMTPAEYRRRGRGVAISFAAAGSPLGRMMIGATDRGLCFLQFGESDEELERQLRAEYPEAEIRPLARPYPAQFHQWMDALGRHLRGAEPHLDLPLDVRATAFQMKVWKYLQSIPYGSVQSYSEVARGIGQPTAARAVASACAHNHVALVIPCHRVIRESGSLGGYRWGLDRKRVLLDAERRHRT